MALPPSMLPKLAPKVFTVISYFAGVFVQPANMQQTKAIDKICKQMKKYLIKLQKIRQILFLK